MSDEARFPRHIAVIMDGNGRWARQRGLPRIEGHRRGIESVREIVTELAKGGRVRYLTLYAFSTENWERPKREVAALMRLLKSFCKRELKTMMDNSIRFTTIGAVRRLPADVREELERTAKATAGNDGLTLCLALNYGGRDELVRAARRFAADAAKGKVSARSLSEAQFAARLDTADMPDPDLLIRTAGEQRLSNFLLWQVSYAELYFTDVLWPDFRKGHLKTALEAYSKRTRKYGTVGDTG
ncbi:MAG: isoprenyl transferase [Planctomycetota bacterium]|jgi:undecaprenyl diphosphate synthase